MSGTEDIRARHDDPVGLLAEVRRRDAIIDALVYQVERNLDDQGHDYGLLQTTFVLEQLVRQRTDELSQTLDALAAASAQATAAQAQLQAAVEAISDGFALFDADGRILMCNPAFGQMWAIEGARPGVRLEVLLARSPQPGMDAVAAQLQTCRSHGRGDGEVLLPGGRTLRVRERPATGGGRVGIYSDVTDIKAEEARVRQRELARKSRLLQSTLDTIDQGIAVFDTGQLLVAWNLRFFELLGVPLALQQAGTAVRELVSGCTEPIQALCVLPSDASEALQIETLGAVGRTLELKRFPMPDGGLVITASDVTVRKEAEQRIRTLLQQQRAIFDNAHVGILFTRRRVILDANPRMAELFGLSGAAALIGHSTEMLFAGRADYLAAGALYETLSDRGHCEATLRFQRRDGAKLWLRVYGRPVEPDAPNEGCIWVYSDVTHAYEQQAELELAQLVFNHTNEALMVCDADNRIRSVNTAFTTITGYRAEEVLGQRPNVLKSNYHDAAFYREMWSALMRDDRWEGEVVDRRKDGQPYPKWLSIRVVRGPEREVAHFVAAFSDISARKAAEERIQYLAHHDTLTGLPNRLLLRDRFEQMYQRGRREGHALAMFFLDLDHFKRVNDTLGHCVGDRLLVCVAERLRACLRACDTVSRLGGDEFIILVEGSASGRFFAMVAEKICVALNAPVDVDGRSLSVGGSLGIAVSGQDGESFDTLMQKADMAMYHTKEVSRGGFSFFDAGMNRDSAERLVMATALRHALGKGELRLVYQPQFALRSARVTGVEALMRWRSAQFGEVSPGQFIPLAEDTGLIQSLGEWALYEACAQARRWADAGLDLNVAVNVSAMQIHRDDFASTLTAVLRDTGVQSEKIELELTESTLMGDSTRFCELIAHLRALGVSLAIDDFGTGYSSLAYLKRFPVSKLKIDRSFIKDIPGDEEDCAIAEAIVRMGQSLHLQTLAEGVESQAQLQFLRRVGCDELQGFLFSRPLEANVIPGMLLTPVTPGVTGAESAALQLSSQRSGSVR